MNLDDLLSQANSNDFAANNSLINSIAANGGIPKSQAAKLVSLAQNGSRGMPTEQKAYYEPSRRLNPAAAGTISFSITRETADIAGTDLFVPVGYPAGRASQYKEILDQKGIGYVGMTDGFNAATAAAADRAVFTFTVGANTDTVRIESDTLNFNEIVQSLFTNVYTIEKLRIQVSNAASAAAVFQKNIEVLTRQSTGITRKNEVAVAASFSPEQQQSTVLDADVGKAMSPSDLFLVPVIPTAGLTVTYTMFISEIVRVQ